jgi:hypothetical protein
MSKPNSNDSDWEQQVVELLERPEMRPAGVQGRSQRKKVILAFLRDMGLEPTDPIISKALQIELSQPQEPE